MEYKQTKGFYICFSETRLPQWLQHSDTVTADAEKLVCDDPSDSEGLPQKVFGAN